MPRPKGPGAIKFLDPAQDDVAMRRRLWRGTAQDSALENKLNELYTKRAKLIVRLINLRTQREGLKMVVRGEHPRMPGALATLSMLRANAKLELPSVESDIKSAETALHTIERQIAGAREQIKKQPRTRQRKAIFSWQEKAVQLMMIHKFRHTVGPSVLSPAGSTIGTGELQKQLRAEGFKVGARELRRFMRVCGVAGQQGKRSDLTSDNFRV